MSQSIVNCGGGVDEDNSTIHLLYEGVKEGKGELCVELWNNDGKIGELSGVWLDIKNIKKMYVRAKAWNELTNSDQIDGYPRDVLQGQPNLQIGWVLDPNGQPFEAPLDESNEVIVLVHGINGLGGANPADSYLSWVNVSESAFKRLWWVGYKGRFAMYKWPALAPAFPFRFNDSEYRAWKCGRGLQGFVDSFPSNFKKNLFSFSQGAVVCGSALTVYGLSVDNYVLSQAAVPAGAYDASDSENSYDIFKQRNQQVPTPDAVNDLGYRGYLDNLNVQGDVVSFYNTRDYALKTGASGLGMDGPWEANQYYFKPNQFWPLVYGYDVTNPTVGARCSLKKLGVDNTVLVARQVTDIHESMSFIARPLSEAAGVRGSVGGSISRTYPVGPGSPTGFGDAETEHGGQWNWNIQKLWPYYRELGRALKVLPLVQ